MAFECQNDHQIVTDRTEILESIFKAALKWAWNNTVFTDERYKKDSV